MFLTNARCSNDITYLASSSRGIVMPVLHTLDWQSFPPLHVCCQSPSPICASSLPHKPCAIRLANARYFITQVCVVSAKAQTRKNHDCKYATLYHRMSFLMLRVRRSEELKCDRHMRSGGFVREPWMQSYMVVTQSSNSSLEVPNA